MPRSITRSYLIYRGFLKSLAASATVQRNIAPDEKQGYNLYVKQPHLF